MSETAWVFNIQDHDRYRNGHYVKAWLISRDGPTKKPEIHLTYVDERDKQKYLSKVGLFKTVGENASVAFSQKAAVGKYLRLLRKYETWLSEEEARICREAEEVTGEIDRLEDLLKDLK